MQYKVYFGTDIAHRPISFEISSLFLLGELRKMFRYKSGPTSGRNFRSGISVPLLKFLYACSVFRSNFVLFISNLIERSSFVSLLFGFCLLSVVKPTFCVSLNAQTLTSNNEELLLSEVSEYESSLNP